MTSQRLANVYGILRTRYPGKVYRQHIRHSMFAQKPGEHIKRVEEHPSDYPCRFENVGGRCWKAAYNTAAQAATYNTKSLRLLREESKQAPSKAVAQKTRNWPQVRVYDVPAADPIGDQRWWDPHAVTKLGPGRYVDPNYPHLVVTKAGLGSLYGTPVAKSEHGHGRLTVPHKRKANKGLTEEALTEKYGTDPRKI